MAEDFTYDDTFSTIDIVELDIFGNDEKERYSVLGRDGIGIEYPELYDNSEPKKGGLLDPRLGTSSNEILCASCGHNVTHCNGHIGHIKLGDPVFRIETVNNHLQKILSVICIFCSKLLIHKTESQVSELMKIHNGDVRMNQLRKLTKNISVCQKSNYGCGSPVPKIRVDSKKSSSYISVNALFEQDGKDGESKKPILKNLTPDMVYNILKNISDDDTFLLGMDPNRSRPEDLILKIFPVPPIPVRPSVRGDYLGGARMEDDLTHLTANIVKANMRILKNNENRTENKFKSDNYRYLLELHVSAMISNDTMPLPKAEQNGKKMKSLEDRIKGKSGRVRGNLMGKRCDYTARTVITCDPTIDCNELSIPVKIAQSLPFPEYVTPNNIERLSKLVRNGHDIYPGANYVVQTNKKGRTNFIVLKYRKEGIELQYGDIVGRHLMNGDLVLLNRQPTLHKHSMMGHKIKVINNSEQSTFKLSVAITTPYGADFDGDEMNIFIPQSYQTMIELDEIANAEKQLITPTTSKTIIGIVQDGLIGAYNLTNPNMKMDWRNAMNILAYTSIEELGQIEKNKNYSGVDIYSFIIPNNINLSKNNFKVVNSQIVEGQLSSDLLGAKKSGNLIQRVWDICGSRTTNKFINDTQRLTNNFNLWNGFTVSFDDTKMPKDIQFEIKNLFDTKKTKIEHMITEIENNPELITPDLFEYKLLTELDMIRSDVGKLIMDNMNSTNGFNIMASSGSKGSSTNIAQMVGCLGLQTFDGKMPQKKYNNRTLPYFIQNDDRAPSRGFIEQSYNAGVDYPEFCFGLIAARSGVIDQAVKSVSGDTEIIISIDNKPQIVQIGDFIDNYMNKFNNDINYYPKDNNLEVLNLDKSDNEIFIPTTNNYGVVKWGKITHITRHDTGDIVYEIITKSGRNVKVSKAKSLIIYDKLTDQFLEKNTTEVKLGDFVPSVYNLSDPCDVLCDETHDESREKMYGYKYSKSIRNYNTIDTNEMNNIINKILEIGFTKNNKFICGFVRGLFEQISMNVNENIIIQHNDNNFKLVIIWLLSRIKIFTSICNENIVINNETNILLNDVVLDEIIGIRKLDGNKFNKLYDLTIPSTLNFNLANGLVVRDTATTGYTQRKLIKSLEDNMIKYDCTVRNAHNQMIQLIYGDSGADTTKQFEYEFKMLELNNEKIKEQYIFNSNEIKQYKINEKLNDNIYNEIINLRDTLRKTIMKSKLNYKTIDTKFMMPVNIQRIVETNINNKSKNDTKLTDEYIHETINELLLNENSPIACISNLSHDLKDKSFKIKDEQAHKTVFKASLYDMLTPKRVLIEYKMSKSQFDNVIQEIKNGFKENIAEPGEMVGVIAAQSTGEPLTQMTISCVDWSEKILIDDRVLGEMKVLKIGEFIDNLLIENKNEVKKLGDNAELEQADLHYLDINPLNIEFYIPSVDKQGKVSWKKIEAVTKHLPVNKDGTDTILKVKTKLGKEILATKGLSFLTKKNNEIVPIRGDELKLGMDIPIVKNLIMDEEIITNYWFEYERDELLGHFIGLYLTSGEYINNIIKIKCNNNTNELIKFLNENELKYNISYTNGENVFIIYSDEFIKKIIESCGVDNNKYIPCYAYDAPDNFVINLLNTINKKCKLNTDLINGLNLLTTRFNVIIKTDNDNDNRNNKDIKFVICGSYNKKYELIKQFMNNMNGEYEFNHDYDNEMDIYCDKIISIEEIKPTNTYVYDFTVEDTRTFMTYSSIMCYDSFHQAGIVNLAVSGVARVNELLSVSKKPKSQQMIIYLTDEFKENKDMAHKIASHLKYTTIGDIRGNINVYYDPYPTNKNSIMENDNVEHTFYHHKGSKTGCQNNINNLPWLIRIELLKDKMLEKELTLLDIKSKFCSWWDKRYGDTKNMKREEKRVLSKITQLAVLSNNDNDIQPLIHIRFNVTDSDRDKFDLSTLDNFIDHVIDVFRLKGVSGITDIQTINDELSLEYDKSTGDIINKNNYIIYASGVNLYDIRYLIGIDLYKTMSNHIMEIYYTFGIEVARATLLREITLANERSGSEINYQHLELIVDQMTFTGTIYSIDRHGMIKSDNDPLAKASFEKTTEQLISASVYHKDDYMRNVSSRIMTGLVIKGGTGYCELEFDTDAVENSEYIESYDITKKFTEINTGTIATDIIKNKSDVAEIFMPI